MIDSSPPPRPRDGLSVGGHRRDPLAVQAAWLEREQPAYLLVALGRPRSSAWRALALALEIDRYRRVSGISSRASAFGPAPAAHRRESRERQQLADKIAQYQGRAAGVRTASAGGKDEGKRTAGLRGRARMVTMSALVVALVAGPGFEPG